MSELKLTPLQKCIRQNVKEFKVDLTIKDNRELFNQLFELLGLHNTCDSSNNFVIGGHSVSIFTHYAEFACSKNEEITNSTMRYWVDCLLEESKQIKDYVEENLEKFLVFPTKTDLLDLLLKGEKLQFRFNDKGQWSNVTDKVTIGTLKHPNCYLRLKPKTIEIDGKEFLPSDAISYIQNQYGVI